MYMSSWKYVDSNDLWMSLFKKLIHMNKSNKAGKTKVDKYPEVRTMLQDFAKFMHSEDFPQE